MVQNNSCSLISFLSFTQLQQFSLTVYVGCPYKNSGKVAKEAEEQLTIFEFANIIDVTAEVAQEKETLAGCLDRAVTMYKLDMIAENSELFTAPMAAKGRSRRMLATIINTSERVSQMKAETKGSLKDCKKLVECNDQKLIQSNPSSQPQNQNRKEHTFKLI